MASSSPFFTETSHRLQDDTVFFSIYPDSSLSTLSNTASASTSLQSLHIQILNLITPLTSPYIWQHEPFSLSPSLTPIPHLQGKLKYGDNLEDEWFTVSLLFLISKTFPSLSITVHDTDGEFLLIETAFHLPNWVNPDTTQNRVLIRSNNLHIIPRKIKNPSLTDSLRFVIENGNESVASEDVQLALKSRVLEYPERALRFMHKVRVRVPVSVALVLKYEPLLVSLAVECFYDRDVDSMKCLREMVKFGEEESVVVSVKMSRAMYGQLVQQKFSAPSCYRMPCVGEGDREGYVEAELGMKIACGMEMMYWVRKKEGEDGRGGDWCVYKEKLEKSGYFDGLISGSRDYKRLLENAEEYYRKSSSFEKTRDVMSAPVKRIDEILAMSYSGDEFKGEEVPASDDDSWLYDGEDELNSVLKEREKEMEFYNLKKEKKQKAKGKEEEAGSSSDANVNNFDLGDISKSIQQFINKVSSYEGAEAPKNSGDFKEVNIDADCFMKDLEALLGIQRQADDDSDGSEGSSMDMDFDDFEDDDSEGEESGEDTKESFMESYSGAMNEELKNSTLDKSFEHVDQHSSKPSEESSKGLDEEFTPIDADFNLVKNLLESYSSQQGLPGPASNLLGLMGLQLPKDSDNK